MALINRLGFNNFEVMGEVQERLPYVTEGLAAHYPLDNTLDNAFHDAHIYCKNGQIVTEGFFKNIIVANSNIVVENDMMKFPAVANSYLELNPVLMDGTGDFELEMELIFDAFEGKACIPLFSVMTLNKENTFSIIADGIKHQLFLDSYYTKTSLSDPPSYNNVNAWNLSAPGTINGGELVKIKICRTGGYISSYINDIYDNIFLLDRDAISCMRLFIGQEVDNIGNNPVFDSNQYFIGKLKSLSFKKFTKLIGANTVLTDFGAICGKSKPNMIPANTPVIIYNNYNVPYKIETLTETLNGNPIYRVHMTPTTQSHIDNFRVSLSNHGVVSPAYMFKANTKYNGSIIYRPVSHPDTIVGGIASNMSGWRKGPQIKLENNWTLYHRYLDGTNIADATDCVHFSCISPSIKLGETIIIDYTCMKVEEGNSIPSPLSRPSVPTPSHMDYDPSLISKEMTVAFEYIPLATETSDNFPTVFTAGWYTVDNSKNWIGIYRGSGWSNADELTFAFCVPEMIKTYEIKYKGINSLIGHKLYVSMTLSEANKTMQVFLYDKTTKTLLKYEAITVNNFGLFSSFEINKYNIGYLKTESCGGEIFKDISFYKRALSKEELLANCNPSFLINERGDIKYKISELTAINKNNIYHLPLSDSATSKCERLSVNNNDLKRTYADGGTLVGTVPSVVDLRATKEISSPIPAEFAWNKALHKDAVLPGNGWSPGYNGGVDAFAIGYHSKWVAEGINANDICAKFINKNSQFGQPNRWLGIARDLEFNAFGSNLKIGDTVNVLFKAKTDKASILRIGLSHYPTGSLSKHFGECIKDVNIKSHNWETYSVSFKIETDWDTTKSFSLYIYGEVGAEATTWAQDILIEKSKIVNEPEMFTDPGSKVLKFNLNKNIGMEWQKPWHIVYWKKPIGTQNELIGYCLESLGSNNIVGIANKGYCYWGKIGPNNLSLFAQSVIDANMQNSAINDMNNYFNKWQMVSLKYDNGIITLNLYTEKQEKMTCNVPLSITSADYFVWTDNDYDFQLGGWDGGSNTSAIYKDLAILKNGNFSDAELDTMFKTKMRYVNNELCSNVKITEV